jgi:ATP-dependent DNA helicase DinG
MLERSRQEGAHVQTFADAEAVLRERLPGYEPRPQQQRGAAAVEEFFATHAGFDSLAKPGVEPRHLFLQAGTGTGKTILYLIPAILSGSRVIVSVTTKALQAQIADLDMPFLAEHLGVEVPWCVLMGRGNYWCASVATSYEGDLPSLPEIIQYADANPDWDGTLDKLPFEVPSHEWAQMVSDAEACANSSCRRNPEFGRCYAERARLKAHRSRIVVVNHSLLCTDLVIKSAGNPEAGMLGKYDVVIADEAHELARVAGDTIGFRMTAGTFSSLASHCAGWVSRYGDRDAAIEFAGLAQDLTAAGADLLGRDGLPAARIRTATLNRYVDELAAVARALRAMRKAWRALDLEEIEEEDYQRASKRYWMLDSRLANTTQRFDALLGSDPDLVRWVEEEPGRRRNEKVKAIRACPVSVAPFLRRMLFSRTPVVLVSATLAVNHRFDYIAGQLGVDQYTSLDVGTPFDFQRQARLFIPSLPDPRGQTTTDWREAVHEHIVEAVNASGGRALVLFTSTEQLNTAADQLRSKIKFPLMVQGEAAVPVLARRFKQETDSVLFGTRSFMTGFDAQGETLSLLIVVRIPMPRPDEPLFEVRSEQLRRAGLDPFRELSLPDASLVLQQAVGRLIRHRNDIGAVVVLDPRLKVGYGHQLLRDLPPIPQVSSYAEISKFLGFNLVLD